MKYSITLRYSTDDEGYVATSPEFPGLSAFGTDPEEALNEAQTALSLFVEEYSASGRPLPEPQTIKPYSGQLRLRIPKTLHERLSLTADYEGVSLNTLMVHLLSEGLGVKERPMDRATE